MAEGLPFTELLWNETLHPFRRNFSLVHRGSTYARLKVTPFKMGAEYMDAQEKLVLKVEVGLNRCPSIVVSGPSARQATYQWSNRSQLACGEWTLSESVCYTATQVGDEWRIGSDALKCLDIRIIDNGWFRTPALIFRLYQNHPANVSAMLISVTWFLLVSRVLAEG